MDALAGHPEARRRGTAPGRRRLHGPAGSARRFAPRGGRSGGGTTPRHGDRRQHAGQRGPGKPWAAAFPARHGRAPAVGDPAAAQPAGLLGRHRLRAFALAGERGVPAGEVDGRRENPCRTGAVVAAAGAVGGPGRGGAVAVGRPGAAAVLVSTHRSRRSVVLGGRRHPLVHRRPAGRLRADDRRHRLRAGARGRRLRVENRCGKGCLDPAHRAGAGRGGQPAERGTAGEDGRGHLGRQFPARVVRPLLDRPLRRARRKHGAVAHRRPRQVPRVPAPPAQRGKRVRAGADGRAGPHHREPTPRPTAAATTPR